MRWGQEGSKTISTPEPAELLALIIPSHHRSRGIPGKMAHDMAWAERPSKRGPCSCTRRGDAMIDDLSSFVDPHDPRDPLTPPFRFSISLVSAATCCRLRKGTGIRNQKRDDGKWTTDSYRLQPSGMGLRMQLAHARRRNRWTREIGPDGTRLEHGVSLIPQAILFSARALRAGGHRRACAVVLS